jgi:signal transduction histidine kinase
MRDKIPNLNAVSRDSEGHIFFGTDGGIVKYNANLDQRTAPAPVLEDITVVDKHIPLSKNFIFSHDENYITVNYTGLWYRNPSKLNFIYQLENYDLSWIRSGNHSVTYSSLPPGSYTFRLKVSDTNNFNDAKETSFHFVIKPPFWRTYWFYSLSLVVGVLLVYSFIQYRERKLRQDKKLLEEKVLERTLEIQRNTEEIQAQNEEIQAQADQIQGINENLEDLVRQRTSELEKKNKALEESAFIIAHELRAPVASILGLINLMTKAELNEEGKVIAKHMDDSAEKLNTIVRTITKAIERGD